MAAQLITRCGGGGLASGGGGGNTTTPAATPTITTAAAQNGAVIATLADTTSGATIYFTTDGSAPRRRRRCTRGRNDPTRPYATFTPSSISNFNGSVWPFDAGRNFIVLNLAIGGGWPGNPDSTTPFPSEMLVDYVRIYSN